jgi:GT2 family glycosyltransferase
MASPLVSVVVPTYNRAHCLPRTVDSALAQTYTNVEVLIVDDGSRDDTAAVVAGRYGADSRVRYIAQANGGVSSARNTGFDAARGSFVALLDSDDVWLPWKLQVQIACMQACPEVGMTWTDMDAIAPDGSVSYRGYLRRMYHAYRWFPEPESLFGASRPLREIVPGLQETVGDACFRTGDLSSAIVLGSLVHTSTVVMTRERLEQVGRFSLDFPQAGEDYEFHLRTCRRGPVGLVDVATILYQTGMADRITRGENNLPLAHAFLRTIEPIIREERATLRLHPRMVDGVLAEAHGWIGEASLAEGSTSSAIRHLLRSLRHQPWQPRLARLLALAALPAPLRTGLRQAYRAVRPGAIALGLLESLI